MEAHFVPPVLDVQREALVESVAMSGSDEAVVGFQGVEDAEAAEALVGCHVLVAEDDVDEDALADMDAAEPSAFVGWSFVDVTSGCRGRVVGADAMPTQVLLTVTLDGETQERLVPLVDELIEQVDEAGELVSLNLPKGMFDL